MVDTSTWYDGARTRAGHLTGVLVLACLGVAVLAVMLVWAYVDDASRRTNIDLVTMVVQGHIALFLLTAVFWLRWFRVVAKRVEHAEHARFRGPWWFWAWVIPGVSLVLPKMMVNDAWQAADRPGRRRTPMPSAITWWWALWVGIGVSAYLRRADGYLPWQVEAFVILPAEAALALLAIGVVRRLTERVRLLDDLPVLPSYPARGGVRA